MAGSAEVIDLEAPAAGGSSATKVAGRDADGAIDLDAAGDAVEGAGAAGSALKPIILDDSKRRAQGGGSEAKRPRLGALGVPEPGTHRGPFAFYLLRTAAEEHLSPRPPFTVSFEELTRGTWTWVIYSNYLIDDRWLTTACPSLTKCPIVVLAPEGLKLPNLCAKNPHVHIIAPQLETKWGTHHSKFMLLFSATGVRVIIHTANGLYHDARDLTQGVWMQDFPLKKAEESQSQFGSSLRNYLCAAWTGGVFLRRERSQSEWRTALDIEKYDYSSAGAHLLVSVPGRHKGADMQKWGQVQLASLLRSEPGAAAWKAEDQLVAQFSSFSSTQKGESKPSGWLDELGCAMSAQPRGLQDAAGGREKGNLRMHVIWPTDVEVRECHVGYDGGSSMPSAEKEVRRVSDNKTLRQILRKWISPPSDAELRPIRREKATPHIKSYLRFSPKTDEIRWIVITSSNMSRSAWGILEVKNTQIQIQSYEMGVLLTPGTIARRAASPRFNCHPNEPAFPECGGEGRIATHMVPLLEASRAGSRAASLLSVGAIPVPLPYSLLPPAYAPDDQPWISKLVYPSADRFGRTEAGGEHLYGRDALGKYPLGVGHPRAS